MIVYCGVVVIGNVGYMKAFASFDSMKGTNLLACTKKDILQDIIQLKMAPLNDFGFYAKS